MDTETISLYKVKQTLSHHGFQPILQEETHEIYLAFKESSLEFPINIRLPHEGRFIQIIACLPFRIQKEMLGEIARFLHILNKEVDLPGFCLDETIDLCFYRLLLPCKMRQLDEGQFLAYLAAAKQACISYAPALSALASGKCRCEDLLTTK